MQLCDEDSTAAFASGPYTGIAIQEHIRTIGAGRAKHGIHRPRHLSGEIITAGSLSTRSLRASSVRGCLLLFSFHERLDDESNRHLFPASFVKA
jgi:hypothetical protein